MDLCDARARGRERPGIPCAPAPHGPAGAGAARRRHLLRAARPVDGAAPMRRLDSRRRAAQQPRHGERARVLPVRAAGRAGPARAMLHAGHHALAAGTDRAPGRPVCRSRGKPRQPETGGGAGGSISAHADGTPAPAHLESPQAARDRRCAARRPRRPQHGGAMGQTRGDERTHARAAGATGTRHELRPLAPADAPHPGLAAPVGRRFGATHGRRPGL
ncbi:hypothetical protein D9M68_536180 [compost metagenome]